MIRHLTRSGPPPRTVVDDRVQLMCSIPDEDGYQSRKQQPGGGPEEADA
jgi:hypothetical protein